MKGPYLNLHEIKLYERLDTGFRLLNVYSPGEDQILTRIDVKIGNQQFAVAFCSGTPIAPNSGAKFHPEDDLITPKDGVIACVNIRVPKNELLRALKELISDIEGSN